MGSWLADWDAPAAEDADHGEHAMPGMMSGDQMADLEQAESTEFDRLFLELMIAHHEGAIEMARTEQDEGSNAEAKALAEQIEDAQAEEVDRMTDLLAA